MHNKSLRAITNKSLLVKSNETLPYDKRIDIKTVKYNLIESKYLKGVSEFLCDYREQTQIPAVAQLKGDHII